MTRRRIFTTSVASVYPHYVAKAQKKGRTQADVAEIILWLTGHTAEAFAFGSERTGLGSRAYNRSAYLIERVAYLEQ